MYTVFLVLQILITLALVGLILIQRNDSDGLGSMGGGGGGNAFMTGRGQANLLTRSTAILAALFMLNSMWLAMMASSGNERSSIADEIVNGDGQTISVPLADDAEPLSAEELLEPEMPVTSTPKATKEESAGEVPAAQEAVTAPTEAPATDAPAADTEEPIVPIP